MSDLIYLASKSTKWRKMAKKCPERGQNHKIGNNSTNMSIWSLKIGQTWKLIGVHIL
jgi:hypothetical protein